MSKPYNNATVEKAHDVRTLRVCCHCDGIGNKDSMIHRNEGGTDRHWHGRCYIDQRGLHGFLSLPQEQTDKLPLGDIGVEAMKALLANRS
jgi:hypothetical protein